jgi:hypothetical protein
MSNPIEEWEKETGQRWDSNDGDNATMAGLFGMLARELGQSKHSSKDDVVAGYMIRYMMTPEYKKEQEAKEIMCEMLLAGLSPEDVRDVFGGTA